MKFTYPRPSKRHPSYRKSLQPSKANFKKLNLLTFLLLWLNVDLLEPDPDPGIPLNPDPDPQHCFREYNSICFHSPYMQILYSSCKTVLFLEVELSGLHVPTTSSKLPRRDSLKAAPHCRPLNTFATARVTHMSRGSFRENTTRRRQTKISAS